MKKAKDVKNTDIFVVKPEPKPKIERKSYAPIDLKTARREISELQKKINGTYFKQKKG
jgi:hypothetical protein